MITIQQNITVHKFAYSELHLILDGIRSGRTLKDKIIELRALPEADYKEQKKTMPGIIFQGEFTKREKTALKKASGLLILDFDHCGKDFKNTLTELPWIYVCFISLGGDGLKALVKIPEVTSDEEYKQYFDAISDELEK
ncbi:MAG: BT4734/BF3469 family protein, partial [Candidatus Paceibacterota bacterium]